VKIKSTIYLDTSVINFLFADDAPELKAATLDLFDNFINTGIYDTFISEYVLREINKTNDSHKKELLVKSIENYPIDLLEVSKENEIESLADEYIRQQVIPKNKKMDALHVALCTVTKMDYLVSWNYKHLANVNREKKVISINMQYNYLHPLRICTPLELIDYGN
jgi:predicted nucleic acid-binding protein